MKNISSYDLIAEIAKDFSISIEKEFTLSLPNSAANIKGFVRGIAARTRIFDGETEHPFMLNGMRNNDVLNKGVELRFLGRKSLDEIIKESGATVKTENCRICEGGGWTSQGTRYIYKDIYCEI